MFPKPGADTTPVPKVSFVAKVGDLICGVGYYKYIQHPETSIKGDTWRPRSFVDMAHFTDFVERTLTEAGFRDVSTLFTHRVMTFLVVSV
jgi:hypothetical protein